MNKKQWEDSRGTSFTTTIAQSWPLRGFMIRSNGKKALLDKTMMGPLSRHRVENPHPGGVPPVHGPIHQRSRSRTVSCRCVSNCAAAQNSLVRENKNPACKAYIDSLRLIITTSVVLCNSCRQFWILCSKLSTPSVA